MEREGMDARPGTLEEPPRQNHGQLSGWHTLVGWRQEATCQVHASLTSTRGQRMQLLPLGVAREPFRAGPHTTARRYFQLGGRYLTICLLGKGICE